MKKSKYIKLHYFKTKQDDKTKRQYKITLPAKMIDYLGWKAKDMLKIWVNNKRHVEIRKKS